MNIHFFKLMLDKYRNNDDDTPPAPPIRNRIDNLEDIINEGNGGIVQSLQSHRHCNIEVPIHQSLPKCDMPPPSYEECMAS
jgi:hypothetical protein